MGRTSHFPKRRRYCAGAGAGEVIAGEGKPGRDGAVMALVTLAAVQNYKWRHNEPFSSSDELVVLKDGDGLA
jgi:hypothetical protein